MRTEEVADGSPLSVAIRYESLVGVSNAIGTHRDPQDLFGALVRELIRFSEIAKWRTSQRFGGDGTSTDS